MGYEEGTRSINLTQLCLEARHRSRRLELSLDAVGDRIIFSALSRSACSTTCCCIAFRTIESDDFFPSVFRNSLCISGLGISDTQVLFWTDRFLDELLATDEELQLNFLRFCLETGKLLGGLSTKTDDLPLPI